MGAEEASVLAVGVDRRGGGPSDFRGGGPFGFDDDAIGASFSSASASSACLSGTRIASKTCSAKVLPFKDD